jgi:hypothetical protein
MGLEPKRLYFFNVFDFRALMLAGWVHSALMNTVFTVWHD